MACVRYGMVERAVIDHYIFLLVMGFCGFAFEGIIHCLNNKGKPLH